MKNFHLNHYERAFGNWLIDNGVKYIAVDEQKRAAFGRSDIKSFDYLLYPARGEIIVAEVKGRLFKGTSFAKLTGFECWVTTDDVDGLTQWQEVFGPSHTAAFVFSYRIKNIDVDFDGRDVYDFDGGRYIFFCVKLQDYRRYMKVRSPKWQTVTLPADKFRKCAVQMQNLLL
jgi:hypothetical protein